MNALRRLFARATTDPTVSSSLAAGLLVLGAFLGFVLSWRGVAQTLLIPKQLPFLVSGGVGGLGLLVAGITILLVQGERRRAAREFQKLGDVLAQARAILVALRDRQSTNQVESSSARSSSRVKAPPK